MTAVEVDPFDASRATGAGGLLGVFNEAGVLAGADVHVALRLGERLDEERDDVLLACALAVRGPRLGHVCVDLASARGTVTTDRDAPVDLDTLPWPPVREWLAAVAASPLVSVGQAGGGEADATADAEDERPLRLEGSRLYLDRYWRQERQVAEALLARARSEGHVHPPATGGLRSASAASAGTEAATRSLRSASAASAGTEAAMFDGLLDRLFPEATDALPREAAATAGRRRLAVIAGGPGTGKTTTVARLLAAIDAAAVAGGAAPPRIALAAPTGKAAARLEQAVHGEVDHLAVPDATRARLRELQASTIHRLLGWRPGSRSRFRHDRTDRLPHDVVVVDETSMVSLSLMAALVDAVRSGARLVLVGDPDQLASVEAGAVLGDVVAPAGDAASPLSGCLVHLRHVHRYRGDIARLAEAVQGGDADDAMAVLGAGGGNVRWIDADVAEPAGGSAALAPVRAAVVAAGRELAACARAGDAVGALRALGGMRLLCAHRRGPYGAQRWAAQVERWLAADVGTHGAGERWYAGRPLLVTANDHALRLYNGDTGVVVAGPGGRAIAAFERAVGVLEVSPNRLADVETVHAMTVHKSQGSQFGEVAVVLPDATSPILTRELLYTAATRAQDRLTIVGTQASIRQAITRPIARASGLADRLRA